MKQNKDVQQGTLALIVLKTLDVLGPLPSAALSADASGTDVAESRETRLGADRGDHRALL